MNNFHKTQFENGLRLVSVPIKNSESLTCLILVGTGSKYETKDVKGMSHFLEHMFFKGTQKRPDTLTISEVLDSVGGQYNAFTSKEMTGYWAKVDKKHIDTALDWISDIFLHSKFESEEIEKEKGVVIEELNMYLDMPTVHVEELFEELLYGDQPAGWRIVGDKETIQAYNREKLMQYFESHYSSKNVVVCIAGDIELKEIEEKTKKYFGAIRTADVLDKAKVKERQQKPEILLHEKKTDQTHFCLGVRTYDLFDKRRYALKLLAVMLGGNMSSRLFINVREKNGLAYSIHTSADASTDTGYLVTQAGIDGKNLEKSIQLILKEYKDFKDHKVSQKELQKAKDYLRGSTALSLESSDSQASFYALQELLEGEIMTPAEKMKKIDEVTPEDIQAVAQDIFKSEKLNLSFIGPFDDTTKKQLDKILTI